MERVSISKLKNRLSAYLKKVRAGHTVLVMDRDQPVARIVRVQEDEHSDDRLVRLERAGLVRRPKTAIALEALRAPAPKAKRSVTRALIEERRKER